MRRVKLRLQYWQDRNTELPLLLTQPYQHLLFLPCFFGVSVNSSGTRVPYLQKYHVYIWDNLTKIGDWLLSHCQLILPLNYKNDRKVESKWMALCCSIDFPLKTCKCVLVFFLSSTNGASVELAQLCIPPDREDAETEKYFCVNISTRVPHTMWHDW